MSNNTDYRFILLEALTKILLDEKISDDLRSLRIDGLNKLYSYLEYYKDCMYMESLINTIAEKKVKMIMQIKSKEKMKKMLTPFSPHFDGIKFIPNEYNVIEEELIWLSETSLRGPLNEIGFKRYIELFNIVFPEYKDISDI